MFWRLSLQLPKLRILFRPVMDKLTPRHLGMMSLEKDLPKMKVPPLRQTMARYLDVIQSLVGEEDFKRTQGIVEEFQKKGGVGPKLQEILLERWKTKDHWLFDPSDAWWENTAYLDARCPNVINYNPCCTFPKEHFTDKLDYIRYSARLITNVLKFRHLVDNDLLSIDVQRGLPMSMHQYKLFLCSSRIPGLTRDMLFVAPIGESKHIVVMHRNQFYSFDVYGPDGNHLSESDLTSQLVKVIENTDPLEPPVGIFTSDERTNWAKERNVMVKDHQNKANFELIERSIIVLCLDKPPAAPTETPCAMERPTDSVTGRQTLHGDGTHHNSLNRWFDKPLELIVSEDGYCGCCYEHTLAEAPTVGRLWSFVMNERKDYKSIAVKESPSSLPAPIKLTWNLEKSTLQNIEKSKDRLDSFINDLDVRLLAFEGYGMNFVKSVNLCPDAWVQIAMQWAYYSLHGHMPPTYETGSTRWFKLGRTENISSAPIYAQGFAKAMDDKTTTHMERHALMRKAVATHKLYTEEILSGNGIDRHLLALKLAAIHSGQDLPALFNDSTYQYMFHHKLATSQVPLPYDSWVAFGPSATDGYGVCYNPKPEKFLFSVSTSNQSPATNTGNFAGALQRCLNEMRALAVHEKLVV